MTLKVNEYLTLTEHRELVHFQSLAHSAKKSLDFLDSIQIATYL